ncbi:MAG: efflux RND transporter permease subunit [Myxococcota bacterium]
MNRFEGFLDRLAAAQHRRAGLFVLIALLLAAAAVPLVMQLGLNSRWEALLPEDKPSVRDLEQARDRVGGLSSLTVAIQSPSRDVEGMKALARDLAPRLETLPSVRSVDWNVSEVERFIRKHRHLYADVEDLQEAKDALQERLDHERAQANPFFVDLLEEEPPDPRAVIERLRSKAEAGEDRIAKYPDGFYVHPDRDLLAMFARTDLAGGNFGGSEALIERVRKEVRALDPSKYGEDLTVAFAGDVVVALEEQRAIAEELVIATAATVTLVLLAIYLFFRRIRAIALLGAGVLPPVLVTFGLAEPIVDYLNTSTAFLGSIVLGNGINPHIIWLARYFEERRAGRPIGEALQRSHRATWLATFAASLAAGLAYASLTSTDFRGFRDFGYIGGMGMALCWLASLLYLPALAVVAERVRPLVAHEGRAPARGKYGMLFAKLTHLAPRPIVATSAALGAAAVAIVIYAVVNDPMEYDFRNLRSEREESTQALAINHKVNDFVSKSAEANGIAILAPTARQARLLERELESLPPEKKAWHAVYSAQDLLPDEQDRKAPLLRDIRELMLEVRPYLEGEDVAELDEHLPPEHIDPLVLDDLPDPMVRPFRERNGEVGRLLYVEDSHEHSTWDGRYLVEWAGKLRELRLPDGTRPPLAGRAPVFADMVEVVYTDGPKAVLLALLATILLVTFTFRSMQQRVLTIGALLLGIAWMGATMAIFGMRLNFLNFVAFPITFGNGVDYGVNFMRRYALESEAGTPDAVGRAVDQTGGAVILCSLTTIIGYISLYTSANKAINSFGAAMAISEVTCVLAALVSLPALLLVLRRRRSVGAASTETSPS